MTTSSFPPPAEDGDAVTMSLDELLHDAATELRASEMPSLARAIDLARRRLCKDVSSIVMVAPGEPMPPRRDSPDGGFHLDASEMDRIAASQTMNFDEARQSTNLVVRRLAMELAMAQARASARDPFFCPQTAVESLLRLGLAAHIFLGVSESEDPRIFEVDRSSKRLKDLSASFDKEHGDISERDIVECFRQSVSAMVHAWRKLAATGATNTVTAGHVARALAHLGIDPAKL